MKILKSVPLADLVDENPDVVKLLKRHHVRRRDRDGLHVLIIRDQPNGSQGQRAVEQVLLLREPVELQVRAVGSGIKCPDDAASLTVGFMIALGRALRRIGA